MRRALFLLAVAVMAVIPSRASASVILDPIIGVRGLPLGDSALMPDASPQGFGPCATGLGLPSGYICSDYEITPAYAAGIFSVDVTFTDNGVPIPVTALTLDTASGFGTMSVIDPFTVRLSGGAALGGSLSCGVSPYYEAAALFIPCSTGNDAVVFIAPGGGRSDGPFTVSMTAINGVSTVPEPGTLLLLGSGIAGLIRNRLRRRA